MEFSLSAEQRELTEATAAFARARLNEDVAEHAESGQFPPQAWQACAQFGIQGLPIPADLGGGGGDILTTVLVMEALSYGCQGDGLISTLSAQIWGLELPLVKFGTSAQQRAYLPGLASGELMGMRAGSELDSSCDALSIRTHAERQGDDYLLNGTTLHIADSVADSPAPDVVLVFAAHAGEAERAAVSAFLVDKGTPGLTVSRNPGTMHPRTSPTCEVVLTDCLVPARNRLGSDGGRDGAGMDIVGSSLELERGCILASALGAMRRQLEACVGYAQARAQFGRPIGNFHAVTDRVADMRLRLEAARLLVYRAAWLGQQGKLTMAEAAAAKLFTGEAWVQSSLDSIQIHGAYGYTKEAGIERDLRGAIAGTFHSGAAASQRAALSRMLGL